MRATSLACLLVPSSLLYAAVPTYVEDPVCSYPIPPAYAWMEWEMQEPVDLAGLGLLGQPGKAVVGEFTIDDLFMKDVVVQLGTGSGAKLVLLDAPGMWRVARFVSQTAIYDMATVHDYAGTGLDSVAFVNGSGLGVMTINSSGTFTTTMLATSGNWVGAKLLRVADLDQDTLPDFIALGSDLRTISIRYGSSSASDTGFTHSANIHDLQVVAWASSTPPRLAFLTTAGLSIADESAVLTSYSLSAARGDLLCPMRRYGDTTDRVACLTKSGTTQLLSLFDASGMTEQVTLTGSAGTGYVLRSGDGRFCDEGFGKTDDDTDLFLMDKSDMGPIVLRNFSSPTNTCTFADTWAERIPGFAGTPNEAVNNVGAPVVADLNGDGRVDVLSPVMDDDGMVGMQLALGRSPSCGTSSETIGDDVYGPMGGDETLGGGVVYLVGHAALGHENANGIQIMVWRNDMETGQITTVDNAVFPIPASPGTYVACDFPLGLYGSVPDMQCETTGDVVYWTTIRGVIYHGTFSNPVVDSAGPPWNAFMGVHRDRLCPLRTGQTARRFFFTDPQAPVLDIDADSEHQSNQIHCFDFEGSACPTPPSPPGLLVVLGFQTAPALGTRRLLAPNGSTTTSMPAHQPPHGGFVLQ